MNKHDSSEEVFHLHEKVGNCDKEDSDDGQPSRNEVLKGLVSSPSALEGGGFRFGVYELVGHSPKPTSDRCGTFLHFLACTRLELHNKIVFDEKTGSLTNYAGLADVHPVFNSCDKFSCPICYERGASVREADKINFRLGWISKKLDHTVFGDVEHIIVGIPPIKWCVSDELVLRKLVLKGLECRGVVGGCLIFHGARFNSDTRRWYWSPHYHVLGFIGIKGGFRKCRGCRYVNDRGSRFFCEGCDGFYGVSKKCWKSDGLIVEVKDKRKSIFGTAWYQLHHATIRTDKRTHIVKWFGVCSYRRLKVDKKARKEYDKEHRVKCRICGSELVRHEYCGCDPNVKLFYRKVRGAREKVEPFFSPSCDWVERPERWRSGSYEE
jgi:hypothetical protein